MQVSLTELQSLLSEMEGHKKAQAANIESLTATLNAKDDIINVIIPLITLTTKHNSILNHPLISLWQASSFKFFNYIFISVQALQQRFSHREDSWAHHTQDLMIGSGTEGSLPRLPQRETTIIGGDSQQEVNFTHLFSVMIKYALLTLTTRLFFIF